MVRGGVKDRMIAFLTTVLRRAWWMACAAALVPIGCKAAHRDVGRWEVTRWTWPEAAAPAAALLTAECALLLLRRRLCRAKPAARAARGGGRAGDAV